MDAQKLGAFIATTRKEKGMTQRELAERLNVTDKAISKWERGLGLPDIKMIEPLSKVLGVTILDIMRGERSSQEMIPTDQVSQVLSNTIDLATHHRKVEQRNTAIACLAVAVLGASVLLIDNRGLFAFLMFYLPIFVMPGVGIVLLISSFRRWRKKLPYTLSLLFGILGILAPLALQLFLIYGFLNGGMIPN